MRYFLIALTFIASIGSLFAQNSVSRVPVYEVFTSSTCPPCKPGNDHMTPIFDQFEEEIVVVKYQMSWPGSGDPYFTSEGGSRRSYYGINSVPALFRNSSQMTPTSLTSQNIEDDLAEEVGMKMYLRYMIDTTAQTVRVRARIEALADYTDGGQRLLIPIIEKTTYDNKKTNGENAFHHVFKKMLPAPQGEIIIGDILEGDTIEVDTTYEFQGDFRLPSNANDQIDHTTEHSVEEFDDLHVVMFMQSLIDKEIYQAAIGVREYSEANMDRGWDEERVWPLSVASKEESSFQVYPNPANDRLFMRGDFEDGSEIRLYTVSGTLVGLTQFEGKEAAFSTASLPAGIYVVEVATDSSVTCRRLSIQH